MRQLETKELKALSIYLDITEFTGRPGEDQEARDYLSEYLTPCERVLYRIFNDDNLILDLIIKVEEFTEEYKKQTGYTPFEEIMKGKSE